MSSSLSEHSSQHRLIARVPSRVFAPSSEVREKLPQNLNLSITIPLIEIKSGPATAVLTVADARMADEKEQLSKVKSYLRKAVEQRKTLEGYVQRLNGDLEMRDHRIEELELLLNQAAVQIRSDSSLARLKQENLGLQNRLSECESLRAERDLELIRKDSELAAARQSIIDLRSELDVLQREADPESASQLRAELEGTKAELAALQEKHLALETEFHEFRSRAKRLKAHLSSLSTENTRLASVEQELAKKTALLRQFQEQGVVLEEQIRSSLGVNSHLAEMIESLTVELTESRKMAAGLEKQLARERRGHAGIMEAMERQQHEIEELERNLERSEAEVNANRAELCELRRKWDGHHSDLLGITRERNEARHQLREARLQREQIILGNSRSECFQVMEEVRRVAAEESVPVKYLRTLMMEFFRQSPRARAALIPVVMRYLRFSEPDVDVAVRSWREADKNVKWF
jgi:chromosome segregation ATPase